MRMGTLLGCALAGMLAASAMAQSADRAMWVWSDTQVWMDDPAVRAAAIEKLSANGIGTLYLSAYSSSLTARPDDYRALIADLGDAGIDAYALFGYRHHHLPHRHDDARAELQTVIDFNAAGQAHERFSGVNINNEPWALGSDWGSDDEETGMKQFLDVSAAYMQVAADAGTSMTISSAMPFWFDNRQVEWEGQDRPMNEHVQEIFDHVAIMSYRDTAAQIISIVESEIAFAEQIGKPVGVGVLTNEASPEWLTFYEEGYEFMEQELASVEQAFADSPAFDGFVIHDYAGWAHLIPEPGSAAVLGAAALGLMMRRRRQGS